MDISLMSQGVINFVTGNKNKAAELSSMLGRQLECRPLDLAEIQSLDVAAVARKKAEDAFAAIGEPLIIDDTGLSVAALAGFPGALVSWALDSIGNEGLLKLMEGQDNRTATVTTALGYADASGVHVFLGEVMGVIPVSARGDGGFGYDPIFIPQGHDKTFAEMTQTEKDSVSMRRLAADQLRAHLIKIGAAS